MRPAIEACSTNPIRSDELNKAGRISEQMFDAIKRECEAFIEVDGINEVSTIDYLTYVLHPTLKDPVREVHNKNSKFTFETAGEEHSNLKPLYSLLKNQSRKNAKT